MKPQQFGFSHSVDFENNTWTFKMPKGFEVTSGEFVIIPIKEFSNMIDEANVAIQNATKPKQ